MKRLFLQIFGHKHRFNTPIVSQYYSFFKRRIIFECKCGKRKLFIVERNFDDPFQIETTPFISDADMNEILKSSK